jgi:hypothetical protein
MVRPVDIIIPSLPSFIRKAEAMISSSSEEQLNDTMDMASRSLMLDMVKMQADEAWLTTLFEVMRKESVVFRRRTERISASRLLSVMVRDPLMIAVAAYVRLYTKVKMGYEGDTVFTELSEFIATSNAFALVQRSWDNEDTLVDPTINVDSYPFLSDLRAQLVTRLAELMSLNESTVEVVLVIMDKVRRIDQLTGGPNRED